MNKMFGLPMPIHRVPPMPQCNPPKPTTEEMLKKALEFAYHGMYDNPLYICERDIYADGKYYAYEDMAAHLEMLIKEAKQ